MGSSSIISVLGFLIVASIMMGVVNKRNNQSYENAYGYQKHVTARDIARNSIQVALREIDTLSVVTASAFPVTGALDGGTFRIDGVIVNTSTIRLTAAGKFSDSTYTIVTTLLRQQIIDPNLFKSPLGIH